MRLNKIVTSAVIVGMGIISTTQLLAACNDMQAYKMNTVYAVKSDTKLDESQEMYKSECLKVLKDYLGIESSTILKDDEISVRVRSRKEIIKSDEELLTQIKKLYKDKDKVMYQEEYKETIEYINKRKKETYDEIVCMICGDRQSKTLDAQKLYIIRFNGNTKELTSLIGPASDKGNEMLDKKQNTKLSVDKMKATYTQFIKEHKLAGIETPVCIKTKWKYLPTLIFQDKKDATKKVEFGLDPATGKIYHLFVR